jgi:acetyl-CoA acetyltransferase
LDAYVLGLSLHPPEEVNRRHRLEEMVYHTAHAALEDAQVTRGQLDAVTLGACDEFDGRSISSMLMAMPAGAYLRDESKVTDSGAMALCLAAVRIESGESDLGMVASWCKTSKTDIEAVMRFRGEPFYTRPLGLNMAVTDALFAQAVMENYGCGEAEISERVHAAATRAASNPRGLLRSIPDRETIARSEMVATPLRALHRAPLSDGAVCLVLASGRWLRRNPQARPLARISGLGWASDSYRLGAGRLAGMNSARTAWRNALAMSNLDNVEELDLVELESQTGFHEAAYVRAFELGPHMPVSPSGGPFAQNPLFCTGLIGMAEAVLQVAGQAGPVQVPGAVNAAGHSCHGAAQQGNIVAIFQTPEVSHA